MLPEGNRLSASRQWVLKIGINLTRIPIKSMFKILLVCVQMSSYAVPVFLSRLPNGWWVKTCRRVRSHTFDCSWILTLYSVKETCNV